LIGILATQVLAQFHPAQKCGLGSSGPALLKSSKILSRDLDFLDESIVSPSGHFRIHFTRTGTHAVVGSESVGIPEFVQAAAISADSVYSIIVGELGFTPPPSDGQVDGPESDIYIKNWNGAYYGMTYFDGYQDLTTFTGYASYLVVDNDYVEPNYATSGLEALKVTIAHEFFHMVQLAYAHPGELSWDNLNWYEISSTWMEEICYPEIDDYHAYVEDNFRQVNFPDINGSSAYSYGHCIFAQILDIEYGSRNGQHIMLDIWENLHGNNAIENLDAVLSGSPWNSSLTDALGQYALYNIFTGSRALTGQYYPDAADLPEIRLASYDLPLDISGPPFEFSVRPLQTMYKKFTVPTLSDFVVKGTNLSSNQRAYLVRVGNGEPPILKGALSNYWIPCEQMYSDDILILPIANGDKEETRSISIVFEGGIIDLDDTIQALWPNPLLQSQETIHLNMILSKSGPLVMTIFDIKGRQIFRTLAFNDVEGVHEMDIQLPPNLSSGLYFLQVRSGATRLNQKFTVVK